MDSEDDGSDEDDEDDDDEDDSNEDADDDDADEDSDENSSSNEEDSDEEATGGMADEILFWSMSSSDLIIAIVSSHDCADTRDCQVADMKQDFGTTYSGVAYAFKNAPNQQYLIKDRRTHYLITSDKCPSVIGYPESGSTIWGFKASQLQNPTKRIDGVKLLLESSRQRLNYAPARDAQANLRRICKAPQAAVRDYLECLVSHANRFIKSTHETYLSNTTVTKKYILTVPAIWSDKAKALTRKVVDI